MNMTEGLAWPRLRFVAAEFIIIVAGVLVALAIDEWRASRQDRTVERQYVARLRTDLERDTARFAEFERTALAAKAAVLLSLLRRASSAAAVPASPVPIPQGADDSLSDMQALFYSQYIALPEAQSAVFREMENTGTLRLLEDPALRTRLSNHYALHELLAGILERPIGPYRELFASVMSGELQYRWLADAAEPPADELARSVQALISHPDIVTAVNSELSYTGAMIYWLRQSRSRAEAILLQLDQLYPK